ncbi:MAG: translation initiation factor IF-2 [Oleispira sp.]|jgi:translation initiation factor IF-2
MTDTTVQEFADVVGTDSDRLLSQMKEAGLPQTNADDAVSAEQKEALLGHLKKNHGDAAEAEPKKISLKRKTTTTLKTGQGGKKDVAVEVRKKRTFVKSDADVAVVEEAITAVKADKAVAAETKQAAEVATATAKAAAVALDAAAVAQAAVKAKAAAEAKKIKPAAKHKISQKSQSEAKARGGVSSTARVAAKAKVAAKVEAKPKATAAAKPKASAKPKLSAKPVARDARNRKPTATAAAKTVPPTKEELAQKQATAEAATQRDGADRNKKRAPGGAPASAPRAGAPGAPRTGAPGSAPRAPGGAPRAPGGAPRSGAPRQFRTEDGSANQRGRRKKLKGKAARTAQAQADNEHSFTKPTAPVIHQVELPEAITAGDLAAKMAIKAGDVIKALMGMGVMATINQTLDQDTATLVVEEMGHKVTKLISDNALEEDVFESVTYEANEEPRAPVVTVMGHVDHGKTSLLDRIRSSRVATGEAGGITQHIGAYHVDTDHGMISFLDTPGHAAFTSMRSRGAQCTDVVILVVAADDGVMPQTREAVQHAKAAGVPIVVAINKMDKEGADVDRVKNELSACDVIPEDWGGDVPFMPVSAHSGEGITELLDAVLLQAELLELKAVVDGPAQGVVIESRVDKGRGPVSTLLVQNGTIKKGDIVLAGNCYGRARALLDENGKPTESAGPSIPVEILGISGTPDAGAAFIVVESEKKAREVAEYRESKRKEVIQQRQQKAKLDALFNNMGGSEQSNLNIILKTDVRGSLEALTASLQGLATDEVKVNIVSSGVGGISETDATLALASEAVIFGFNVRADGPAKRVIESNELDLRYYSIIYDLIDDIRAAMSGLLAPELREEIQGVAEVREVFTSPKFGLIAGSMVTDGTIYRNKRIRVLRENVVVYEGELESLRRFKDDVQEVRQGMECGIGVKNYQDVRAGDQIEVYIVNEIARTL